ncbi:hypothetical protein HanIR_Chr05g0248131 [Helianthus annuus]|nr:hypothetical protein HanIR_Chr05g0248131 [Helianthus annuus]
MDLPQFHGSWSHPPIGDTRSGRAGPEGGQGGQPNRARDFVGHVIFKKKILYYICKKKTLIGYNQTNINIGPLKKIMLFKLFSLLG